MPLPTDREKKAFQQIWELVKTDANYVPRNYQTIGGMWTTDTYKLGDIRAQVQDEGYTRVLTHETVRVVDSYPSGFAYLVGDSAALFALQESLTVRYYEIIGYYSKKVIGVTTSIEDVLAEEPESTFAEITKEQYQAFITASYDGLEWTESIGKPVTISTILQISR